MFNLNDESLSGGVAIFNGGNAGKVNNVTMSVTKKSSMDADNTPAYKLVFTADDNTSVNQGFYYFEPNPQNSDEKNGKNEGYLISRVLSAAKAVVPKDFKFPEVANSREALDALFAIMKEHAPNNKVNVFVTYGTKERPSQYLGVRYFDFVESADTPENTSRLKVKNTDMMERVVPDAPSTTEPVSGPKSW
jgi:hypothetical protein